MADYVKLDKETFREMVLRDQAKRENRDNDGYYRAVKKAINKNYDNDWNLIVKGG